MIDRKIVIIGAVLVLLAVLPAGARRAPALAVQKPSAEQLDPQLVGDLVTANRILTFQEIFEGYGHVSVRNARNPDRYLLSRSIAPGLVTPADVMEFDLESRPIAAAGRSLYSERFIHGEIYRSRPTSVPWFTITHRR